MSDVQKSSAALTGNSHSAAKTVVETGEYSTPSEAVGEVPRGEDLERLRELWRVGKAVGDAVPLDMAKTRDEARRRLEKAVSQAA